MRPSSFTPFPRRWPLFGLAALLLLIALAVLLTGDPAQAQTTVKLVSNTGQTSGNVSTNIDQTQAFTTGSDAAYYTLTRVDIRVQLLVTSTPVHTVSIHSDSSNAPGASLGELTLEGSLPTTVGPARFNAPGNGIDLAANTTYWLVSDVTGSTVNWHVHSIASDAEDSGAASGWSIANTRLVRVESSTSWSGATTDSSSVALAIHGYAHPVGRVRLVDIGGGCGQPECPDAPTGYADPGDGVITVRWDPASTGGSATRWDVSIRESGGSYRGTFIGSTQRSHTFSELDRSKTYDVRIRGDRVAGGSVQVGDAAEARNVAAGAFADAGYDEKVGEGERVTLDGTRSRTPRTGATLTYAWTQTGGPTVTLDDATAARPAFVAPSVSSPTDLTFSLVVNDGTNTSAPDTVTVTVTPIATFLWAKVEGKTLTVTFDENLDTASAPAGSAFTVTIAAPDGTARTIAGTGTAALSGRTATVTLASAIAHASDEKVTLSYTKPSTNPLRDAHGNNVANFSGKQLTDYANLGHAHFVAGMAGCATCPDMPAGYAEPGFGDGLIEVHWTPATTGTAAASWTIQHRKSGTTEYTTAKSDLASSARNYQIKGLEPGVRYDILMWGKTAAGDGDRAYAANVAAGVTDGPNFASATVDGSLLTVTFDRALNEDSVPDYDRFEVRTRHGGGEGIPRCQGECLVPVTGVSISGKTVTLTLAQAIPSHGRTTLKYTRPPSSTSNNAAMLIGQAIGYPAAPFHEHVTHAADTDAPLFSSAQLFPYRTDDCAWRTRPGGGQHWTCLLTYDEKAFLEVLFNEVLDEDAKPAASAFRVTATPPGRGARTVAVTRVAKLSGNEVRLETGPVPGGKDAKIAVSYVRPSVLGLRDRAGNRVESFSRQPVTNGMPMIESIGLVSDPGPDRTYGLGEQVRVEVTFDTAVEVYGWGGRPRLKLDLTPESGGQRWAYWDGRDETDTLTFTYTVAGTDVSTAGIAVAWNPIDLNGSRIGSFHAWPRRDRRPPATRGWPTTRPTRWTGGCRCSRARWWTGPR